MSIEPVQHRAAKGFGVWEKHVPLQWLLMTGWSTAQIRQKYQMVSLCYRHVVFPDNRLLSDSSLWLEKMRVWQKVVV